MAFAVAVAVGFVNGMIVVRTGLPSFIVTLAGLFILRGLTIGFTRGITGRTQISGLQPLAEHDWLAPLFYGTVGRPVFAWLAGNGWITASTDGTPLVPGMPVSVVWWVMLTLIATWVLLRTRVGNWIFASGGDANAARNVGVPVAQGEDRPVHLHRHAPPPSSPACRPWAPARRTCCAAPSGSSRRSSPR